MKIKVTEGDPHPGDIVKVRAHMPAELDAPTSRVRALVRKWAEKRGVVLHTVQVVRSEDRARKRKDTPKRSDDELLRAYAKSRGADNATLRVGLNLMEKT